MPLIVEKDFLKNNNALICDLKTAREMIDIIIKDLDLNDKTHINYVLEKLGRAESILLNVNQLCLKASKLKEDLKNE